MATPYNFWVCCKPSSALTFYISISESKDLTDQELPNFPKVPADLTQTY